MALHIKLKKLLLVFLLTADWQQAQVEGAKLSSKLVNGLCNNLENYKSSKQMAAPLKKPSQARAGGGLSSNSWISWRSCEGTDNSCEPFSFSTAPASGHQGLPSNPRPGGPSGPAPGGGTSTSTFTPKVIVTLKTLSSCKRITRSIGTARSAHIRTFVDDLKSQAKQSQAKVLEILEPRSRSGDFKLSSLWILNEIAVEGSSVEAVTEMLRGSTDVESIALEEMLPLIRPTLEPSDDPSGGKQPRRNPPPGGNNTELWDKPKMRVLEVWAAGFNGSGIRLANIDTGVYLHKDLKASYANDEFSWFDPIDYSDSPNDQVGHGTNTMGIMVAANHTMGVAPGATWMACKSCNSHECPDHALKKCLEWVICPTSPDGGKEDCSKAPRIVNCSWGRRVALADNPVYRRNDEVIACIRSAGIIPVFAMGNDGDKFKCYAGSYPASLPNVIAVGNVARNNHFQNESTLDVIIHNTTSPGPAHPDYNAGVKPDIGAPGAQIWFPDFRLDASQDEEYLYFANTGTSFSAPNVAGTIALMLQRNPDLTYDQVKAALIASCTPVYYGLADRMCGGISETIYPNHRIGYGCIDAYDAVFNNFKVNNKTGDKFCERG